MLRRIIDYFPTVGRDVYILSLGWFVSAMGFAASMPFISIYFSETYGMSVGTIGLYFGSLAMLRSFFQALSGEYSDRIERRSMVIHVQWMRAISFLGLAAAIYWKISLIWMSLVLITNFVLGAMFQPVANAMVSDYLDSEKRLEGYALTRSAGNLGWAAGPAFGGFLAANSYAMLFAISAVLFIVSSLVFFFFLKAPEQKRVTDRFHWRDLLYVKEDPLLLRHCLYSLLLYLVVAQLIVPFSVYAVRVTGLPEHQLGYLYMINGLLVAVLQIPITRLMSGTKLTRQIAFGAICYAIGYALVGWSSAFYFLIGPMIIITFGENLISPPLLTMTSRLAKEGRMGRYMGIYGLFQIAGWSFGPLYGGEILDRFADSPQLAWGMIASLAIVSAIGYLLLSRRLSPEINTNPISG